MRYTIRYGGWLTLRIETTCPHVYDCGVPVVECIGFDARDGVPAGTHVAGKCHACKRAFGFFTDRAVPPQPDETVIPAPV